jgi:hypothetical protein
MNVKFVKSLHVWVPWNAKLSPWLSLLYILAEEANGLPYIQLGTTDANERGFDRHQPQTAIDQHPLQHAWDCHKSWFANATEPR